MGTIAFAFWFFGLSLLPLVLKLIFTSGLGPQFEFYFYLVWLPAISLSLSLRTHRRSFAATCFLLFVALTASILKYPHEAMMDFRRQFISESAPLIVAAVIFSLGLQLYFHRQNRQK